MVSWLHCFQACTRAENHVRKIWKWKVAYFIVHCSHKGCEGRIKYILFTHNDLLLSRMPHLEVVHSAWISSMDILVEVITLMILIMLSFLTSTTMWKPSLQTHKPGGHVISKPKWTNANVNVKEKVENLK